MSSSLQQVRVSHSLCWKKLRKLQTWSTRHRLSHPKIQNTYFAFECARGDILETRVWGLRELRLNCDFSKALRVEEGLDLTVYLAVHRLVLKMISLSNPGSTLTPTLNSFQLLRWAWAYGISSLFTTHHHNLFSQILKLVLLEMTFPTDYWTCWPRWSPGTWCALWAPGCRGWRSRCGTRAGTESRGTSSGGISLTARSHHFLETIVHENKRRILIKTIMIHDDITWNSLQENEAGVLD